MYHSRLYIRGYRSARVGVDIGCFHVGIRIQIAVHVQKGVRVAALVPAKCLTVLEGEIVCVGARRHRAGYVGVRQEVELSVEGSVRER